MPEGTQRSGTSATRPVPRVRADLAFVIEVLALLLAGGAVAARIAAGAKLDGLLIAGAAAAALLLTISLLLRRRPGSENSTVSADQLSKELLDSAGPMVMGVGLDGRFTYLNPAAERMPLDFTT